MYGLQNVDRCMKENLWIGIIYLVFRILIIVAIIYYCVYEIRKARKKNG